MGIKFTVREILLPQPNQLQSLFFDIIQLQYLVRNLLCFTPCMSVYAGIESLEGLRLKVRFRVTNKGIYSFCDTSAFFVLNSKL
jgi:hypothetical protein